MSDNFQKKEELEAEAVADWIEEYGDRLFKHAFMRVGARELAEDLVQDTFLSALKGAESFKGNSSVYTWLYTILKNKIVDHIRKESRRATDLVADEVDDWHDELFNQFGLWKVGFSDWSGRPEELLNQKQFRRVFDACLLELSDNHRRAFVLKVVDGYSSSEVCEIMNISPNNLSVLLYRARMSLRKLLDEKWFKVNGGQKS